jgi:hypothetical protein
MLAHALVQMKENEQLVGARGPFSRWTVARLCFLLHVCDSSLCYHNGDACMFAPVTSTDWELTNDSSRLAECIFLDRDCESVISTLCVHGSVTLPTTVVILTELLCCLALLHYTAYTLPAEL